MDKKILKFPINIEAPTLIKTQGTFAIVRVAYQRDQLCVWVEITDNAMPQTMEIAVFGTGESIPLLYSHVGSVESPGELFIWHVYANYYYQS